MTNEKDECLSCKYEKKTADDEPCKSCRNNYVSQWEPVPKTREFTADELVKIFKDKFVERRAIGLLDIENVVKELFE